MASRTSNPFAKERATGASSAIEPGPSSSRRDGFSRSFSRSSLLPKTKRAVLHQVQDVQQTDLVATGLPLSLPAADLMSHASPDRSASTPAVESSSDKRWRLLWRGGLEVGKEGYRLDGIAFCAKMSFPTATRHTPVAKAYAASSGADVPALTVTVSTPLRPMLTTRTSCGSDGRPISATPFSAASSADTDLCLSLESMKGKKWLKVKEVVKLSSSEELEKVEMVEDGIQVFIAPTSLSLQSYIHSQLGRDGEVDDRGRTKKAMVIALGDGYIDNEVNSQVLLYGQLTAAGSSEPRELVLMAARRKTKKAGTQGVPRPGEPLPRAPLFPSDLGKRTLAPGPSSRRSSASSDLLSRSRSTSTSSVPAIEDSSAAGVPAPLQELPASKARATPGRRGEKRKKPVDEHIAAEEIRRKRNGKMSAPAATTVRHVAASDDQAFDSGDQTAVDDGFAPPELATSTKMKRQVSRSSVLGDPDDPFGPGAGTPSQIAGSDEPAVAETSVSNSARRTKITPTESANRAVSTKVIAGERVLMPDPQNVKKRIVTLMEWRGLTRTHDAFKDIYGMVNRGACFALRDVMAAEVLAESRLLQVISAHLDLYWSAEHQAMAGQGS